MYLSIDGGATKTHILLLDEKLQVLDQSLTGPLNFSVISPQKAIADVKKSLSQFHSPKIQKAIIGISGVDTLEEKLNAEEFFASNFNFPIQIITDAEMALYAGTDNPQAIVLIAGTGSICLGHNYNQNAKSGGLDWRLSDEGSSFAIGNDILKAAVRSFDGRGLKTCLENLLLDHFRINDITDLKNIVYQPDFNKSQIADLAKLLDISLKNHDTVSKIILENNIGELLISLRPVVKQLDLDQCSFDLVLAGSLFTKKIISTSHFSELVHREFPQAKIILLTQDPVFGGINYLKKQ